MKTIKIIDLLNKIANREEVPKKIKITILDDRITKKYSFCYDEDNQEYRDDELFPLGARLILERVLNEKVEIIEEEKEIKQIPIPEIECKENERILRAEMKINELIDAVNEIRRGN